MRRLIAPCACVLALVTGAWFGQAYTLFAEVNRDGFVADAPVGDAVATAWRFYDAIDHLFRTGEEHALRDVVAPEFVDHVDEPAVPAGRDTLVRYLTSLRETHPALRLVPETVVAQGDRVVAQVAMPGAAEGVILGLPLAGAEPWPRIDMVRVAGGRIVERWGHPAGYAPSDTLFSEALTITPPRDLVLVLERLSYDPGATGQTSIQRGPAILSVESGILDVTLDDGAAASPRPAAERDGGDPPPEPSRPIGPGETVVVPDGVAYATANRTDAPAVVLVLTLRTVDSHPLRSSGHAPEPPPAGITSQGLAGYTADIANASTVTVELARVTLIAGSRIASHGIGGVELVAVDAGTLTATIQGFGWLRNPAGHSTTSGPSAQVTAEFGLTVTGDGASASYRNETDRPVTLLLLRLTPR